MLPDKSLNIYPKTEENIQALIDYYFAKYNVYQVDAVKRMKERTSLSLNQLEYILKKLSEAYEPIFKKHLFRKTPGDGDIALTNLFTYGIEALEEKFINTGASKNRQKLTKDFMEFVMESEK